MEMRCTLEYQMFVLIQPFKLHLDLGEFDERGLEGLGRCHFFNFSIEDIAHLFLECPISKAIWDNVARLLKLRVGSN